MVTQHEFKDAVQRVLGHGMSEQQWGVLKNDVGLDPDELRFLNTTADTHSLNLCVECEGTRCRPGAWNRKEVGHFFVRKITMPPAVERIKQYSSTVTLERAEERVAKAGKSGCEKMRERVDKHEASSTTAKKSTCTSA